MPETGKRRLNEVQRKMTEEAMDQKQLLLLASFLAMEPPHVIVKLAREVGDGVLSDSVQSFFYGSCISNSIAKRFPSSRWYLGTVLKQFILAAEADGQEVLDDLYEQHITYLNAFKETGGSEDAAQRCYKSYLYSFPDDVMSKIIDAVGKIRASRIKELVITIRVSSNMLEGSTGCYAWPAGLFLSEFLLTYPAMFSGRCCLEIGAGAGVSSICLAYLNASKVISTDGDGSTLANLKHNLSINRVLLQNCAMKLDEQNELDIMMPVECLQLSWDSTTYEEIANFGAEIMLGADVIYDPVYIPHLVRLFTWFLSTKSVKASMGGSDHGDDHGGVHQGKCDGTNLHVQPVVFLATVVRNIDTLNMFITSARQAGLLVEDITHVKSPSICLPHVTSIDRSKIYLHKIIS